MLGLLQCICFLLLAGQISAQGTCTQIFKKTIPWKVERSLASEPGQFLKVNAKWPADAVKVKRCTELTINVENLSGEDLTLHFHGILQNLFQTIQDGAQSLSQGAIPKTTNKDTKNAFTDNKFTYTFLADKEGTYWIHSHSPGQYPKGVRAPLIVTRDEDAGDLGYDAGLDKTLTLSDWWLNFTAAEERSLATGGTWDGPVAALDGTCGDPSNPNGFGLEYPADKVLFNDVGGHNAALGAAAKTVEIDCSQRIRLQFVNLSSHSRFYVFFADKRTFKVVEMDGISYQPRETDIFEVASGQRVSIVASGKNLSGTCASTYIVAASDPKVAHGTKRCPMNASRGDLGVQFTHGYLNVKGQTTAAITDVITPGNSILDGMLKVWAVPELKPPEKYRNFQTYPSGSWEPQSVDTLRNRMKLASSSYRILYYTNNDHRWRTGFGAEQDSSREQQAVLGLEGMEDLLMKPLVPEDRWLVPGPVNMHYITLGIVGSSNAVLPAKGGFAAMSENFRTFPNQNSKLMPFIKPDNQGSEVSRGTVPALPSLFSALQGGLTDTELLNATRYDGDKVNKGHTIMLPDASAPHWFILRSAISDHPMHLHGHHFQILAKLPERWYDASATDLLKEVTSPHEANRAFPIDLQNPPKRDTLLVEKGITYVIAIKPDNPGVWAFHCHNDIHARSGMFSQVVERPADLRKALGSWKAEAPADATKTDLAFVWNIGSGAGVYGNENLVGSMEKRFRSALVSYGWSSGRITWRAIAPSVKFRARK
ncbi:MAG: hypothetical protein Q9195_009427 [Heterodermia aff. obscurata]